MKLLLAVLAKTEFEKPLYHELYDLMQVTRDAHETVDKRAYGAYNLTAFYFFFRKG